MNLMRHLRSGGPGKTEVFSTAFTGGMGSLLLNVRLLARNRFLIRHAKPMMVSAK